MGMKAGAGRLARGTLLVVLVASLGGCGLPRSGPTKKQIFDSAIQASGDAHIVTVDTRVARATAVAPALGFAGALTGAGVVESDTIRPGDRLSISIWENVDQGVLSSQGRNATVLQDVQVDGAGFIFIPYAGRIRAAGNNPEALRMAITRRLETQTPDPQVLVGRAAGDGATVSVIGSVGAQGNYPIERPTRTLSAMLAQAGGVTVTPEIAQISVIRGSHRGTIWLNDLYRDPANDIALRPGDRILVEEDSRAYTAIGATGGQNRVSFDKQQLSALEAVAQVGGLNPARADPTGIFVFRDERAEVANRALGRSDLVGPQRVVYVINLTEPSGVFVARDFQIRDEDTIYVTEAPFVQWQNVLGAITGTVGSANTLSNAVDRN
jgi:polysaccharide biosynthesis/export protein